MRTVLFLSALFSLCGALRAQEYTPAPQRELPRSAVIVYPTQQQAALSGDGENCYRIRLDAWTPRADGFSTTFTVPFAWINRQVIFYLEQASGDYELRVNGHPAGTDRNANSPSEFNITKEVKEGRNTLEIIFMNPSPSAPLESWKEAPEPALGAAWIMSQPTMRVRDVMVKSWRGDAADTMLTAEVGIVVKSSALNPRTSRIYYELLAPSGETVAAGYEDMTLDMRREDTLRFLTRIPPTLQWSAEQPVSHTLRVKTRHEGRDVEFMEFRPGFRAVEMRGGQLSVNGALVTLRAHEVRPDITETEIADLREKGYNTLRLLPGAVPPSLYDICDRLGMYVIVQAPVDTRRSGPSRRKNGNPSNDPAWLDAYVERAEDSYHTSKLHPSVIAFSLARQSSNGINLYETYLHMKRYGDSRPFIYPDAGGEWNNDPLTLEEFGAQIPSLLQIPE